MPSTPYITESGYTVPLCNGPHAKVDTNLNVPPVANDNSITENQTWLSLLKPRAAESNQAYVVQMEDMSPAGQGDMLDVSCWSIPATTDNLRQLVVDQGAGYYEYVMYDPQNKVVIDINGNPCKWFHETQTWKFNGGHCSYAISNRAPGLLKGDSDHVLFVEYCKLVANVLPPEATDSVRSPTGRTATSGAAGGRAVFATPGA